MFIKHVKGLINNDRLILLTLTILSFFINIAYNFSMGSSFMPIPANNTKTFMHHAHAFSTQGFQGLIEEGLPLYYFLYPIFITFMRSIFSGYYTQVILIIQILLFALAAYFIFKITSIITSRPTAFLAAALFVFTWQILRWSHFILPDSINIFLIIFCAYYLILLITTKDLKYISAILIITTVLLLLRPTNILFALITLTVIIIITWKENNKLAMLLPTLIIIPLILLSLTFVDPANHLSPASRFQSFSSDLQEGIVIPGMPQYDISSIHAACKDSFYSTISHYSAVIAKRILYFWSIYHYPFSLFHNALNIFWLGPLFAFAIYGFSNAIKKNAINQQVNLLLIAILLFYTLFHAVTHVDYDMRYRSPLLAFVIIYSSYGITSLYQRFKIKRTNH